MQDVFKKGSYSRASHRDLSEKLKLNGEVGVNVMSFFSGSTKLGLDKSSTDITDEDIRQANEGRDYFLNDSARQTELNTRLTEKTLGEMKLYATKTKTLELYRVDSREIARTTAAAVIGSEDIGVENIAIENDITLQMESSDGLAAMKKITDALVAADQARQADFKTLQNALAQANASNTASNVATIRKIEAMASELQDVRAQLSQLTTRFSELTTSESIPLYFSLNHYSGSAIKEIDYHGGNGDTYDIPKAFGRKVTKVTVQFNRELNQLNGLHTVGHEVVEGNRVRLKIFPANGDHHSIGIIIHVEYVPAL